MKVTNLGKRLYKEDTIYFPLQYICSILEHFCMPLFNQPNYNKTWIVDMLLSIGVSHNNIYYTYSTLLSLNNTMVWSIQIITLISIILKKWNSYVRSDVCNEMEKKIYLQQQNYISNQVNEFQTVLTANVDRSINCGDIIKELEDLKRSILSL